MLITSTREKSKLLNHENGPRILISASGMMTGGRVLHHAQRVLPDPKATIVFCGYQSVGTTGRHILEGEKEFVHIDNTGANKGKTRDKNLRLVPIAGGNWQWQVRKSGAWEIVTEWDYASL